jgi:predicted DNA-binding protein (MmcQ/YjbR family)
LERKMITLEALRDYAYTKPGAVISSISSIDSGWPGHEYYGIQRDFKHGPAWFAAVFINESSRCDALYFCHTPATVDQLYRQHHQLHAAEPPLKNRSKIYPDEKTELRTLLSFIDMSYDIVLAKLTKKLQAQIKLIANQPNAFPCFTQVAQELTMADKNWQIDLISSWGGPLISYQLPKRSLHVGRFAHNQILLGELLQESKAISADRRHEWKDLIVAHKEELLRTTK